MANLKKNLAIFAASLLGLASSPAFSADCPVSEDVFERTLPVIDGLAFAEGPVWHDGRWLFSDIFADQIVEIDEKGSFHVLHEPSGWANGNAVLPDGRMVSARHNRSVVIWEKDGTPTAIATHYENKRLNSPNDLVVDNEGAILFTDPPFGITGYGPNEAEEEQPVRGVYRLVLDRDGEHGLQLLTGALSAPNGIALDDENAFLYVSDTVAGTISRFEYVAGPDSAKLRDQKVIAEPGAGVDGLALDRGGRLYAAQNGGLSIYDLKEQIELPAEPICSVSLDQTHVSNVAIEGNSLLVTATDKVILLTIKQ